MDWINGMIAFAPSPALEAAHPTEIPAYVLWAFPLVVIGVVVSFFISTFNSWLLHSFSKKDRTIEGFTKQMQERTDRAIEERFVATTLKIENHVNTFTRTLDDLQDSLHRKEDDIKKLAVGDVEVKLEVAKYAATKEDMQRHEDKVDNRLQSVNDKLDDLRESVVTKSDLQTFLKDCGK